MKKIKVYLRWTFLGSLWFLGLVLAAWAVWEKDGFLDYRELQDQKTLVFEEKRLLMGKNRELSRKVWRLQEDREYMEAVTREQLGMVPLHAKIYLFENRGE